MIYKGVGKKKESVAKIFIKKGKNSIKINKSYDLKTYFNKKLNYKIIFLPIYLSNIKDFEIKIFVTGGGKCSQILAIMNGLSRAILNYENSFKKIFSDNKLISRDSRIVERKKLGKKKSRKSRQFSKR